MSSNQEALSPFPDNSTLFPPENSQEESLLSQNPTLRPFYERIPCLKPLLLILLLQLLLFGLCYCFVPTHEITAFIQHIKSQLQAYYSQNLASFLLCYFGLCFVTIACFLPTISLFTILFTMITRRILFSWAVTMLIYVSSECLLYFAINVCLKKRIRAYVQRFRWARR